MLRWNEKHWGTMLCLAIVAAVVTGLILGLAGTANAAAEKKLRFASINPTNHPTHPAIAKFVELVESRAAGQIKIDLFLNGVLGQERALTEGVMLGTIDAAVVFPTSLSTLDPMVDAINLPYIWRDSEHAHKVLWGPIGDQIAQSVLKKTRIRILGWPDAGFRQVITVNKPINALEDLKGLKIRVPESPNFIELFRRLGANPTPVPWGEVYTALQTKLVDGAENDFRSFIAKKLEEPTNFLAITNHIFLPGVMVISEKTFQGLDPALQGTIAKSAKEAVEYQAKHAEKDQIESFEQLKKKLKITHPDLKPFRDRLIGYQDEWAKKNNFEELVAGIRSTR